MRTLAAALILLIPSAVLAAGEHGGFTKHKQGSFFTVTAEKRFSIEFDLESGELKVGTNRGELVIHDKADNDVKGAKITVTPWMPGMGHGVPEVPVITEKEGFFGSRYFVENLVINMGGHWEVLVEIEKDGVQDGAVFDFADVGGKGGGAMKHDMMKRSRPDNLDLSTTVTSTGGTFTLSWESEPAAPPLNRIHTWTLSVKSPKGEPVIGATISVDGGMPEHGHGLPTEPEAGEEVEPGKYLVEGMKFSMPGWWEVSFQVDAEGRSEKATFNLTLT